MNQSGFHARIFIQNPETNLFATVIFHGGLGAKPFLKTPRQLARVSLAGRSWGDR